MKERQDRIDFHRNYCIHYNPREAKTGCDAGMDKQAIQCVPTPTADGSKMIKWGPCIAGHTLPNPCDHCPKWERRSQESAEEYADAIEASLTRMIIVEPIITEWRKKAPQGKKEVITCPVCSGRLHLDQSSYNGHIRAKCETANCVSFVE